MMIRSQMSLSVVIARSPCDEAIQSLLVAPGLLRPNEISFANFVRARNDGANAEIVP
jgi:hypothetical protein